MASVGVRELRQRASELLRRVEAGETIQVTDRGRPVALLAPLPESEPLAQLRAAREVIPATARLADLPAPLPLGAGQEPLRVSDRILTEAGSVQPPELRSLDAIQLATIQRLGSAVTHVVSYDDRLSRAAAASGYPIAAPA
jgi:prevent-host-death family protein